MERVGVWIAHLKGHVTNLIFFGSTRMAASPSARCPCPTVKPSAQPSMHSHLPNCPCTAAKTADLHHDTVTTPCIMYPRGAAMRSGLWTQ